MLNKHMNTDFTDYTESSEMGADILRARAPDITRVSRIVITTVPTEWMLIAVASPNGSSEAKTSQMTNFL
ncbi:MAG: hypothetical protein U9Q68_02970 [Euryarchaeota archaeon]|nr:hypothetical protein [Euryarchaeota archaeon]